jgi:hypothetical protein
MEFLLTVNLYPLGVFVPVTNAHIVPFERKHLRYGIGPIWTQTRILLKIRTFSQQNRSVSGF